MTATMDAPAPPAKLPEHVLTMGPVLDVATAGGLKAVTIGISFVIDATRLGELAAGCPPGEGIDAGGDLAVALVDLARELGEDYWLAAEAALIAALSPAEALAA